MNTLIVRTQAIAKVPLESVKTCRITVIIYVRHLVCAERDQLEFDVKERT